MPKDKKWRVSFEKPITAECRMQKYMPLSNRYRLSTERPYPLEETSRAFSRLFTVVYKHYIIQDADTPPARRIGLKLEKILRHASWMLMHEERSAVMSQKCWGITWETRP